MKGKRKRHCPKCRSTELHFREYLTVWMLWEFSRDDSGLLEDRGYHNPGDIFCVWAFCESCGHKWRLRGVTQITDLPEHPEYHPLPPLKEAQP